jgi:hypothetical protein
MNRPIARAHFSSPLLRRLLNIQLRMALSSRESHPDRMSVGCCLAVAHPCRQSPEFTGVLRPYGKHRPGMR